MNELTATKSIFRFAIAILVLACGVAVAHAGQRRGPSFYKDIQPIIYNSCVSCHRPGQSAPFSLVTYNEVVRHASMIKYVTGSGYMPPWKADTAYRHFVDQRVLSAAELTLLTEWIDKGMQAGDPADAVPLPFTARASNLGRPDLVVTAPEVFTVPGNSTDTVTYFVMHYSIPNDTNVLAFEFVPGNSKAVHHGNTWVFPEPEEYDRVYGSPANEIVPAPVQMTEWVPDVYQMWVCVPPRYVSPAAELGYPDFFPDVPPLYYDGWVPGTSARTWPTGFGFRLPKRGVIIMQLHYGPTPIPLDDQSFVNIFFTPTPVERFIESYNIGTGGGIAEPEPALVLPPDSVRTFEVTTEVSDDQSYIALNPHMHYLGREMKAYAIKPDKDTIPLVWIKKWDFRWQEFYKPLSPIHIPKGSILKIVATFDNTSANPDNRFSPPRQVVSGSNTTDEMMSLIVMSVKYQKGDEDIKLRSDMPVADPVRLGAK